LAGLSCFQVRVTASVRNDPGDKAGRLDLCDGQTDAVNRNRSFFGDVARSFLREADFKAGVGFLESDNIGSAINVTLHEMSAQAVGGGESPLQVHGTVAFKRAEICSGHCFLHEIECDVFTPMRGHGKAAAVHGNAVAGVNAPGDTRRCELQLRFPVGCTNP
jgi:hypothetical protein